jgi:tripartite ATP-independent transporter DctM subunit
LLCSSLFIAWVLIWSRIDPKAGPALPKELRVGWKEKFKAIPGLIPPLLIICVVLGGIWFGVFTATEAGGIGAFTAFVYALAIRALKMKDLKQMSDQTLKITTMVLLIAVGGNIFTSVNGILGTNAFIQEGLRGLTSSPFIMMLILLGIVILMGTIMDLLAIAMIALPIMMPIIQSIGVDPFYFGFMFAMSLIIGTLSPPFGYTMFYFAGLNHKGVTMWDIYKAGIAMSIMVTMVLFLCLLFPQIPTWLPSIMIKAG